MTMFEVVLMAVIVGLIAFILLSNVGTRVVIIEPKQPTRKVRSDKGKKRGSYKKGVK